MGKTIFFNIPAQGHINPALPVIAELVRRGETVLAVNSEHTHDQHEPTGATFVPYPYMPDLDSLIAQASEGNLPRNALMLNHIIERTLPFTLELLRTEKPDYIIFDALCAWAKHAAAILNIPAISSNATFILSPATMMPFLSPSMLVGMMRQMLPVMPEYQRTARRVKQQFGVKLEGLMGAVSSVGDMKVIYTSRDFQPKAEGFDPSYKFIGPSISARSNQSDFPFEALKRRPVVYISLGTVNNHNLDFYRQCFAAFADYPGQFVLSAGKQTDLNALGDIPDNFIVRNFVPQLEVLQRSDLFITHGGMNSVQEGLWYGVPLIPVPQQLEQAVVARQVEKRGAGIALGAKPPFGKVSAAELRAAAEQILRDSTPYHRAALCLGDSFRRAGGYVKAVDEILAFAKAKQPA